MNTQYSNISKKIKILKQYFEYTRIFIERNRIILYQRDRRCKPHTVNINWWKIDGDKQNIGDFLANIIVNFILEKNGIDSQKRVKHTKHLYTVGSIIDSGF